MAALLATAIGLTVALAATGARASYARSLARDRMDGTLGRASLAQMEFRARHQRFALWDELAANGARLPGELRVVTSNAGNSHWFLKVQDLRTGLTCARIGQLLDAPDVPVAPDCESDKR